MDNNSIVMGVTVDTSTMRMFRRFLSNPAGSEPFRDKIVSGVLLKFYNSVSIFLINL